MRKHWLNNFVICRLRAELKAIHEWPAGELHTETERAAVIFRKIREQEIRDKIAKIASAN
jgi:hypothetical protein